MHLLLPAPVGPAAGDRLDDDALARLYAYPAPDGAQAWVRVNFVSTLDGAATGADGRSGSINTGADREVFALLRALADVVVIGAGTARAEGYRRAVTRTKWRARRQAAGQQPHPAVAVVSRSAQVPPLLAEQRADSGRHTWSPAPRQGHGRWTRLAPRSARTTSSCTGRTPST